MRQLRNAGPRRPGTGRASPIDSIKGLCRVALVTLQLAAIGHSAYAEDGDLPPSWSSAHWNPAAPQYTVAVSHNVPIRMSDGVVLRATIAYPADRITGKRADGAFPVLLEQTPYRAVSVYLSGTKSPDSGVQYFVQRGYIYVTAQVRGTYRSGGNFGFFSARERRDGVELVNWAGHTLVGTNGRVGLIGCSYPAIEEYFTAEQLPKDSPLKAMATGGMGADLYRQPFFVGGAPSNVLESYFSSALLKLGSASPVTWGLTTLANAKEGGELAYDGPFWVSRAPMTAVQHIVENRVPVLMWSGWHDFYPESAAELFVAFQNAYAKRSLWEPMAVNQPTTPKYQLIVGDGTHCAGGQGGARDRAYLEWFDTWLKSQRTGLRDAATPLHYYVPELRQWREAASYPASVTYTRLYLEPTSNLSSDRPSNPEGYDAIAYGPPSADGTKRVYTSQPFAAGALVGGPISATIYANSSRPEVELIINLVDVAPDGRTRALSSGALTGSMRGLDRQRSWYSSDGAIVRPYHDFTKRHPIDTGKFVRFDIQMQLRMAAILPGNRLRLILSTAADLLKCDPTGPMLECPDPTIPQQRDLEGGVYQLQVNRTWASYVSLSLAPLSSKK